LEVTGVPHFLITVENGITKKTFAFAGAQDPPFIINAVMKLSKLAEAEEEELHKKSKL
jgi:hypothetical protein